MKIRNERKKEEANNIKKTRGSKIRERQDIYMDLG
jgi:hypothetical protein